MTDSGSLPSSRRSGFHLHASSPQISLLRFDEYMPIMMVVPLGTCMDVVEVPSRSASGVLSGIMISRMLLGTHRDQLMYRNTANTAYSRDTNETGG